MFKKYSGFTLIELMVTISVLAVVLILAIPSFQAFFERGRLRGATDEVVAVLATARGEAVKSGRNVTVAFDKDGDDWCVGANQAVTPASGSPYSDSIKCDCFGNSCLVDGVVRVVRSSSHPGVGIVDLPDPDSFTFDGKQGVLTDLESMEVNFLSPDESYQLRLNISPLGQSRSCVPTGQKAIAGVPAC